MKYFTMQAWVRSYTMSLVFTSLMLLIFGCSMFTTDYDVSVQSAQFHNTTLKY